MDLYGASREIQEFHTEDPIYSQDALLIASEEEYGWLKRARPSGREEALKVLDRTEDEQQEWENRAYEHARIALGLPVEPGELRGIHLNGLYEMLLAFRAESEIDRGMLWHFKSHPEDEKILLTGEFVGWASDEDSGAIVMRRISRCHWAAVVPEVSPRPDPYAFKFVVEREGNRRWANGLYPVDHHDPYKNSLISVSGQETYFQKEAAAQRLRAIEQSLTPGPEDSGLRYGQKVGGDWGRERGSGVTEAQVRADRERERRIALGPQVYDSLERISQAARHKEQPDILKTAQEFIENRPPSAHRSRRVYVADLSDLWGYPIHERDSLCVSRDLLQDPRELDLTLSRQLGAL
jgi:hypothetical protein